MKINDTWSITGGNGDFILTESRVGKNPKTGKPTVTESRTYHPSLEHCAKKIGKVSAIDAVSLAAIDDVIVAIERVEQAVREKINAETEAV